MRPAIGLSASAILIAACSTAPSPPQQYTTPPAPTVTSVSPTVGSTDGGTLVMIEGTGLQGAVIVTLGSGSPRQASRLPDGRFALATPPHAAGVVDVVVNVAGRTVRLPAGYTYAPPGTFDFNGRWSGSAVSDLDESVQTSLALTVEGNIVTSFSCGTAGVVPLTPAPVITDGAFTFTGDGMTVSGRLTSATSALGWVNVSGCSTMYWFAAKQ